ncbi:transcriptional repressor UlaR [Actinobacillus equuli]|nr:transcriptional repressor UlaR [Actinobacillus equuli]
MQLLGQALCGQKLQIITNFLPLANYLIEHQHEDIVIMGGQYNKNKKSPYRSINKMNLLMRQILCLPAEKALPMKVYLKPI